MYLVMRFSCLAKDEGERIEDVNKSSTKLFTIHIQ